MSAFPQLDVRQTLQYVLASRSFARAEQLRLLLAYLVTATLDGHENSLKETVIGVDVFGLPASFNPKSDPTVRMAMRRLRSRLNQYYAGEGMEDPQVISLEPGRYAPRFLPRSHQSRQRISLAVLPFGSSHEGTGDADSGGLIREALLEKLSESGLFRLVGTESAPFLPGADVSSIAEKLQARYVVRGACHADGARIQICTELLCPQKSESVWTGHHEQTASAESWTVQSAIAAELEKQVLAAYAMRKPDVRAAERGTGINRLILQGRYHLHQDNTESIRKAESCFMLAVEKQPSSALAWAGLSITQSYMRIYYMAPAQKAWQEAKVSAEKAFSFDSSSAEVCVAQGMLSALTELKPALAGRHFERALAVNPDENSVRLTDAIMHLVPLGKLDEAEDQIEMAMASDPLNPRALRTMASVFYFQRRFEMAADLALAALDITPQSTIAWFTLANSYHRLGRQEDASKAFRRCEELMPFMKVLKWPSVLAAVSKSRQKWVRPGVLAAAKLMQSSSRAPSVMLADLLIRLGEQERALSWLERAFRERDLRALYLAVDPAFDQVRDHPRYRCLVNYLTGLDA